MTLVNMIMRRASKRILSDETLAWHGAFTKIVGELAPGEVFEIVASEDGSGGAQFELKTESPRVMVAWSEVQNAVAAMRAEAQKANEINDLRSQ